MATFYASVWASGRLVISPSVPEGAIAIAKGPEKALRKHFGVVCRHGYKRGVLLVPGIPEAPSQDQGIKALQRFVRWASGATEDEATCVSRRGRIYTRRVPSSVAYRGSPAWNDGAH